MKLLLKILTTAVIVLFLSSVLSGVAVAGFGTSIIVALVLGLLNLFVKPLMVLFTLPVTLLTLGLFLFVINAVIILLCSEIVAGFHVDSFWTALLFSILLSVLQSVLNSLINTSLKTQAAILPKQ